MANKIINHHMDFIWSLHSRLQLTLKKKRLLNTVPYKSTSLYYSLSSLSLYEIGGRGHHGGTIREVFLEAERAIRVFSF